MSIVTIALLTPEEALALKLDAEMVLLSLKRRKFCECENPFSDGAHCGKCGKAFPSRVPSALYKEIHELENYANEQQRKKCLTCDHEMTLRIGRERGPEFWWCRRCETSTSADAYEPRAASMPWVGHMSTKLKHRKPGHVKSAGSKRGSRKPQKRWTRERAL